MRIAVIGAKTAHNFKSTVAVASLERAADYDINIFSCDSGKCLVKIEIIAGEKAVSDPLVFKDIGL